MVSPLGQNIDWARYMPPHVATQIVPCAAIHVSFLKNPLCKKSPLTKPKIGQKSSWHKYWFCCIIVMYAPIVKWYNSWLVIINSQFDSVWGHQDLTQQRKRNENIISIQTIKDSQACIGNHYQSRSTRCLEEGPGQRRSCCTSSSKS